MSTDPSTAGESMDAHVYLISDATGETLTTLAKAAAAQFPQSNIVIHPYALVRKPRQMDRIVRAIRARPGLVMSTVTDTDLAQRLDQACHAMEVIHIKPMQPVVEAFEAMVHAEARPTPGAQHVLDDAYFQRIAALDFTMAHDDGAMARDLENADVVLTGVSRTSKTPTAMYLAHRGIKVANVPLVPGRLKPKELTELRHPLIVGLTASPDRLVELRRNRLRTIRDEANQHYAEDEDVRAEIQAARRFFTEQGWPVVDVTHKSIEETAAAIMNLLETRGRLRETGDGGVHPS